MSATDQFADQFITPPAEPEPEPVTAEPEPEHASMASQLGRKEECTVTIHVHYVADQPLPPDSMMWIAADPATCLDFGWEALPDEGGGLTNMEGENMSGLLVPSETEAGLYSLAARFKRGSTTSLRVRLFDTNDPRLAHGGGFQSANGANTVVQIPDAAEATVHLSPTFHHQRGAVHKIPGVVSPQLDNERDIWVYLPPSNGENAAVVYDKVLIQWDGRIVPDALYTSTLDAAILGGDMDEVVVVGIDGPADGNEMTRSNEMTPTKDALDDEAAFEAGFEGDTGKGDLLIDFVLDTVLPLVSKTFANVQPVKGTLGASGYSLGGLMSAHALFTRRDDFNRGNLGSSSFWWDDEVMIKTVLPRAITARPAAGAGLRCWVDMGSAEGETMVPTTADVVTFLQEEAGMVLGEDLAYVLDEGAAHETNSFTRRLWQALTFMYASLPLHAAPTATAAARL